MKKTLKLAVPAAALATFMAVSAFADDRHRDETWRGRSSSDRYEDRSDRRDRRDDRNDFVRAVIERIDHRRDILVVRDVRTRRVIAVDMDRLDERRRNRRDITDLRRGDVISLTGEWRRNGSFEAYRITDIDSGRRW
jgi:Ni/Co efflux regulator RcnB